MKTTRDYDIGNIEEKMAKGIYSRKKGKELIEKIYKQSKDSDLEERRKKLIEDARKEERKYRMVRTNPESMSKEELRQYIQYFKDNPHKY